MKLLYVLTIAACFTLLAGCAASLQQVQSANLQQINSLSAFNGIYQNIGTDHSIYNSLWHYFQTSRPTDTVLLKNATIRLAAVDEHQINATWETGGNVSPTVVIKGQLKNGYFVSNPQRTIIPIPLIYGKFKNIQFQLSLNKDRNLQVDKLHHEWGWVFVFLANNDTNSSNTFKKIGE